MIADPRRWWGVATAYAPAALAALLLPKCPVCLAALLGIVGVSVALPAYSYGLAIAISAGIGTLALVVVLARRSRRARDDRDLETHALQRPAVGGLAADLDDHREHLAGRRRCHVEHEQVARGR